MTLAEWSPRNPIHVHALADKNTSSHAGTSALTLRPRLNRASRERGLWPGGHAEQVECTNEGTNHGQTEVKVQRKATEVTELVSRQRNAGREAGGGPGRGEVECGGRRHKNTDMIEKLNKRIMGGQRGGSGKNNDK